VLLLLLMVACYIYQCIERYAPARHLNSIGVDVESDSPAWQIFKTRYSNRKRTRCLFHLIITQSVCLCELFVVF